MAEVPVIVLDHLTPAQRKVLVIADNRLALSAGWDEKMLRLEVMELREEEFDLDLLGFSQEEIDEILADEPGDGHTDEDSAPELPETPVTMAGDLWVLGAHKLLCGDATSVADVDRLLSSEKADLVFTDAPYNVDYEGYTEDRLTIKGRPHDIRTVSGVPGGCVQVLQKYRKAHRVALRLPCLDLAA